MRFRCQICNIEIVNRQDYREHLRTVHPGYFTWTRKNLRNSAIVVFPVTAFLIVLLLLASSLSFWVLVLGTLAGAVLLTSTTITRPLTRRRFRHEWKQNTKGQNAE